MITHKAKGQSERERTRIKSGRAAARTLYTVCPDAIIHLPPEAAALRVNQPMTSPVSSVWKVWREMVLLEFNVDLLPSGPVVAGKENEKEGGEG